MLFKAKRLFLTQRNYDTGMVLTLTKPLSPNKDGYLIFILENMDDHFETGMMKYDDICSKFEVDHRELEDLINK